MNFICIFGLDIDFQVYFPNYFICTENQQCTTPNNLDGNCIVLQQCGPLYSLLSGGTPTMEQRAFLRNSQCGRQGNSILVCCPPKPFTMADLPQTCGEQVEDKVFGGEETNINELPWYVSNLLIEIVGIFLPLIDQNLFALIFDQ